MKAREDYEKRMAEDFNKVMGLYKSKEIEPLEAVIQGVQLLKFYFNGSHAAYKTPVFDINAFEEAINSTGLGRNRKILDHRMLQGCLIEGLIQFGSNRNQAGLFLEQYENISATAVKDAYKLFKSYKDRDYVGENEYDFALEFSDWVLELVKANTKTPPNGKECIKATKAFNTLLKACNYIEQHYLRSGYSVSRIRPYQKNDIGFVELENWEDTEQSK